MAYQVWNLKTRRIYVQDNQIIKCSTHKLKYTKKFIPYISFIKIIFLFAFLGSSQCCFDGHKCNENFIQSRRLRGWSVYSFFESQWWLVQVEQKYILIILFIPYLPTVIVIFSAHFCSHPCILLPQLPFPDIGWSFSCLIIH